MSRIRADRYTNREGTGAPTFSSGVNVVGISSVGITTITGIGQTALTVNGDARVTGNITTQQINDLNYPTAGALSNRNLIINGAMNIWQRNNTYNVTNVSNDVNENYQSVDRFAFSFGNDAGGTVGIAKTTEVPLNQGFSYAYKVDVVATTTATANEIIYPVQIVEAQDMRNSGWNYSDPNSFITISFWTKSNKTGTYNLGVFTDDGVREFFTKEYTINSSDTWEYKEISIPGSSGIEFDDDNGLGLRICWHLCAGPDRNQGTSGSWSTDVSDFSTSNQINFMDTVGNNWYLTGVQLEVGTRATPFEHRRRSEELTLCQRYYQRLSITDYTGFPLILRKSGTGDGEGAYKLSPPMRTTPSGGLFGGGIITGWRIYTPGNNTSVSITSIAISQQNQSSYMTDIMSADYVQFRLGGMSGGTADVGIVLFSGGTQDNQYYFDSEL